MMLLHMYQIFSSSLDHLWFFVHFFFTFMEHFFIGHISRKGKYGGSHVLLRLPFWADTLQESSLVRFLRWKPFPSWEFPIEWHLMKIRQTCPLHPLCPPCGFSPPTKCKAEGKHSTLGKQANYDLIFWWKIRTLKCVLLLNDVQYLR